MRTAKTTSAGMGLRVRMLLGFIACAALAALVGVIGIIATVRTNATIDMYISLGSGARDSVRQIDIAMLQGRRDEKDFLMRLDAQYAEGVKKDVAALVRNAQDIKKVLPGGDTHQPQLDKLIKLAGDYQAGFLSVAQGIQTKGTLDTGAYGAFRTKAHEVEAAVLALKQLQLERDYLEIRRNEKDYLLRLDPAYVTQNGENIGVFKSHLAKSGLNPATAAKLAALWDEYAALLDQVVAIDKQVAADTETYRATVHEIDPIIAALVTDFEKGAQGMYDSVVKLKNTVLILIIGTILAAVILALLLGTLLSTNVTRQVGGEPAVIAELARRVADGDLRMSEDGDKRRSTGIFSAIKDMVIKLNEVLYGVRDAAAQVASSSEEISSSAQQLATGAQGQAATLEQTSASIEELTASVEQVSEHSQNQAASVEQSSSSMTQMKGTVEQVSKTLGDVSTSSQESIQKAQAGAEAVVKAVGAIKAISASSEKIAGIINVISDIADQTNLLALNASIEAARAGEHGRGFAVVADEVSKLADRSAANTKEIDGLIKESGKSVTEGVRIAQGALDAMEAIIAGAKKTNEMVSALSADVDQQVNGIKEVAKATESISEMSQSISAATEEQSTNAKQVSKAIENVNELTQQAASAAEEMSAATEELSSLAQRLLKQVETFKLSEEAGAAERELTQSAGPSVQSRSLGARS